MQDHVAELLERVRLPTNVVDADDEERNIAMAAANGSISDSRVTVETMRAAQTIVQAARKGRT